MSSGSSTISSSYSDRSEDSVESDMPALECTLPGFSELEVSDQEEIEDLFESEVAPLETMLAVAADDMMLGRPSAPVLGPGPVLGTVPKASTGTGTGTAPHSGCVLAPARSSVHISPSSQYVEVQEQSALFHAVSAWVADGDSSHASAEKPFGADLEQDGCTVRLRQGGLPAVTASADDLQRGFGEACGDQRAESLEIALPHERARDGKRKRLTTRSCAQPLVARGSAQPRLLSSNLRSRATPRVEHPLPDQGGSEQRLAAGLGTVNSKVTAELVRRTAVQISNASSPMRPEPRSRGRTKASAARAWASTNVAQVPSACSGLHASNASEPAPMQSSTTTACDTVGTQSTSLSTAPVAVESRRATEGLASFSTSLRGRSNNAPVTRSCTLAIDEGACIVPESVLNQAAIDNLKTRDGKQQHLHAQVPSSSAQHVSQHTSPSDDTKMAATELKIISKRAAKAEKASNAASAQEPIPSRCNVSGYKGVYPGRNGRWQAQYNHQSIGGFCTAWEAGVAVAKAQAADT